MKRLIAVLGLVVALALCVGGATVLADEGGSQGDNNATCRTPGTGSGDESGGGDRMSAADHESGTSGSDNLDGTSSGDDENGGRGNDVIDGNGGNDELNGDQGDDEICGDQGDDVENGGPGDDNLDGGPGNDTLNGGSGNDVETGDAGNDTLNGGKGRNLLIGGTGADSLGAQGDDILIAGTTAFDNQEAALAAIMAEWGSADSYATRVKYLSQGGGLNGSFLLKATTVFDDSSPDKLTGGAGQDWFFANVLGAGTLDKVTGKHKSDVVTDI